MNDAQYLETLAQQLDDATPTRPGEISMTQELAGEIANRLRRIAATVRGEALPSAHTAIDALLDEMLWIARARADTRAERDAASNEIAAHRAAIHDAVRGLRGGEAPQ